MMMDVEKLMERLKTTALERMLHKIECVEIGGVPEEM